MNSQMPSASPRERRALLGCLSVGLLAVALGVVSLVGQLPPLMLDVWSGAEFWKAAGFLALDAILVFASGRLPRAVAGVAFLAIAALLVSAAGFGLYTSFWAFGTGEPYSKIDGIQVLVGFGLFCAVQWFCLKAVIERLG